MWFSWSPCFSGADWFRLIWSWVTWDWWTACGRWFFRARSASGTWRLQEPITGAFRRNFGRRRMWTAPASWPFSSRFCFPSVHRSSQCWLCGSLWPCGTATLTPWFTWTIPPNSPFSWCFAPSWSRTSRNPGWSRTCRVRRRAHSWRSFWNMQPLSFPVCRFWSCIRSSRNILTAESWPERSRDNRNDYWNGGRP